MSDPSPQPSQDTSSVRGLDVPAVTRWMQANVAGAEGELSFRLIAAGGSNLTYRVESKNGRCFALRRPPERARIATAHDMAREWKIMAALDRHRECGVPVPAALAYCGDQSILGAEFYVMSFAEGRILRGPAEAADMDAARCRRAAESLIGVQVAMHTLDADAVDLGDLGRKDAYVERQLSRWLRQYEAAKSRELPLVHSLHALLSRRVPRQQRVGLVHGDYRFDNTVLGADDRVIAVLDWELCTLGDPVADFCWSILYWSDPGEPHDFGSPSPTRHPAFPRRAEAIEMYARRSGLDLSELDYYRAFSWWKMACLVEGVVARLRAGAGGGLATSGNGIDDTMKRVEWMLECAAEAARSLER
jgi:aminoglycoside phosphotransferase (APT) family kinase protein